jgi:hypothetical protein
MENQLALTTDSSTPASTWAAVELARATTDERALRDDQFAIVRQFADAPLPAIAPIDEVEFGKLMAQLSATLSMRKTDDNEGTFKLSIYRRMLGHLPHEVMQRVVRQSLAECDWMPTPAAMLRMAENATTSEAIAHSRARYLVRERRQRESNEKLEQLKHGELQLEHAGDRLLQIGMAQGHVFRKRDGSYAYRTAENLAADSPPHDSDRNPEGEDGTASSRSDESAGPQGHRTDAGALPDSMKEQAA